MYLLGELVHPVHTNGGGGVVGSGRTKKWYAKSTSLESAEDEECGADVFVIGAGWRSHYHY